MSRFVFRRKAASTTPSRALAERATRLGARVVAQTDNMVHVEGSDDVVKKLQAEASDFVSAPLAHYPLPTAPRVKAKKRVR